MNENQHINISLVYLYHVYLVTVSLKTNQQNNTTYFTSRIKNKHLGLREIILLLLQGTQNRQKVYNFHVSRHNYDFFSPPPSRLKIHCANVPVGVEFFK